MSCEQCHKFFKGHTPCGPCRKPFLLAANEEAWAIFQEITSQARVGGMGGVFGFEFSSLHFVFTVHQIPEDYWFDFYYKLTRVWNVGMKYWNAKEDRKK